MCKRHHDNSTPNGRREHENQCPTKYRKVALNSLISDTEKQLQESRSHLMKTFGNLNDHTSGVSCLSSISSAYGARPDTSMLFGEPQNFGKKRAASDITNEYVEISQRNVSYDCDSGKWSNYPKSSTSSHNVMEMRNMDLQRYDEESYVDEVIDFDNESEEVEEEDGVVVSDEEEDSSLCENVTEISDDILNLNEVEDTMISSRNVLFDEINDIIPSEVIQKRHFYSSREKAHIELASILCSINAPAHVYSKVFNWAKKARPNDLRSHIKYKTLMSQLACSQGLRDIFPTTHVLPLPSGNCVKVTKFSFTSQLKSLLSDKDLMCDENLIFGGNIFKRFDDKIDMAGDIESSMWYRRTQKEVCKLPNDVLCPIVLYIDKTYAKSHPVEPISFTLGKVVFSYMLDLPF